MIRTIDSGRKHDLKELSEQPQTKQVREAIEKIKDEQKDSWTRDAREALIQKKRSGSAGDVRDVSDAIIKRRNMGIGKTQFAINISQERWDQIFNK